ncbi:MAG: dihydrolipoamide acetyltransferase family protein [Cyclobacteriaceae bacterium]
MAKVEMVMPKMGESIMEGTILKWLKQEGDFVEQDESVVEVATDKVDTEVPASHSGVLKKILVQEGEVAEVGKPIALIEQEGSNGEAESIETSSSKETVVSSQAEISSEASSEKEPALKEAYQDSKRFYSPLVKNIARQEGLSLAELENVEGSGKEGRVTKKDILNYISQRSEPQPQPAEQVSKPAAELSQPQNGTAARPQASVNVREGDEVIEMDRMRKMISQRMLDSRKISAHVTSFVEADVTNLVSWREKIKNQYKEREGEAFTYTPIFIEAIAQAIKEFPMINVSVDGDRIIKRSEINIGMAVALPNGNLIVPVIRNADQLSLLGLSKKVNQLAKKARNNQLKADELSDGTYTVSNIGAFGNILGTPIIMQPQVAIMALGTIQKKPSVIETPTGDALGIRHKMYLSHSYDHRVVDGALGGMFVKRVGDLLENFDTKRII